MVPDEVGFEQLTVTATIPQDGSKPEHHAQTDADILNFIDSYVKRPSQIMAVGKILIRKAQSLSLSGK